MANDKPKNEGFVLLHRKVRHDWKWSNPTYRAAWTWIIVNAEWNPHGYNGLERGQVRFSIMQAPKLWGMSKSEASRFLGRCEQDGDITWKRGTGGRRKNAPTGSQSGSDSGNVYGNVYGVISICNYNMYQDIKRWLGSQSGSQQGIPGGNSSNIHPKSSPKKKSDPASQGARSLNESSGDGRIKRSQGQQLVDYFIAVYQEIRCKAYAADWPRDTKIMNGLLKAIPFDDLKDRIRQFLEDDSDEYDRPRKKWSVPVFKSAVDAYGPKAHDEEGEMPKL